MGTVLNPTPSVGFLAGLWPTLPRPQPGLLSHAPVREQSQALHVLLFPPSACLLEGKAEHRAWSKLAPSL